MKILKLINTIYNAQEYGGCSLFLEWVPFDRFEDTKQIGEGGFAKVYSAKWIDGQAKYTKQDNGSWKILEPKPINVALKRLNGSQNMSAKYLNEVSFIYVYTFKIQYFILIYFNFNVNNSLKHIGVYTTQKQAH